MWHAPPIDLRDPAFVDWQPDEAGAYCTRCGASVGRFAQTPAGCSYCIDAHQPWQSVTRLSAYVDPMRQWIREMKFAHSWAWARWMGRHIAERLPAALAGDDVAVCHVPMHWRRRWRRGFNQSQLIAEAVASHRRCTHLPVLQRPRPTRPQTLVRRADRWANVRDSFALAPIDLTDWRIVLVDDVKTTGSTLRACTRLLTRAGAESVHIAVAAVGDPRDVGATGQAGV